MTNHRKCPDCKTDLTPIKVVDQIGNGLVRDLTFTIDEPRTSAWSGKIKNAAGTVEGHLCEDCHRLLFYAKMMR